MFPDDRTARARLRDTTLHLFAQHGPDAVTIRQIAESAGTSPALINKHFGSREGLITEVDTYVLTVFQEFLALVSTPSASVTSNLVSLTEQFSAIIPPDSDIPAYLTKLLTSHRPAAQQLFQGLYSASCVAVQQMSQHGAVYSERPDVTAAFLLVNDLAVMMLRPHLTAVLGFDPLTATGLPQWSTEVSRVYGGGLTHQPDEVK